MNLNYFDAVLLVILLLFLLRGVMNGFLSEISGLLGLFGGLWYAHRAYRDILPYLEFLRSSAWRGLVAYGIVFFSVIISAALVVHLLSKCFSLKAPPPLDKTLGAVLGTARGMAICSILLVLLRHFLPDMDFFKESFVASGLQPFLDFARQYLPVHLN